jgi:hypothetical protein
MNEIKMQNERIGVDSEALNIEATWGRDIMEERGLTYLVDILQGLSQNDPLRSF